MPRLDVETELLADLTGNARGRAFPDLQLPARQLPFIAPVPQEDYPLPTKDDALDRDGEAVRIVVCRVRAPPLPSRAFF